MSTAERLHTILDSVPGQLLAIGNAASSIKPAPEKWSKKEILGHLIDSAANNHQRFIRAQLEEPYTVVSYAQDEWVRLNGWQQQDLETIVRLWHMYNRQIAVAVSRIPKEKLDTACICGKERVTLGWLIGDYIDHMEYHLKQVLP